MWQPIFEPSSSNNSNNLSKPARKSKYERGRLCTYPSVSCKLFMICHKNTENNAKCGFYFFIIFHENIFNQTTIIIIIIGII